MRWLMLGLLVQAIPVSQAQAEFVRCAELSSEGGQPGPRPVTEVEIRDGTVRRIRITYPIGTGDTFELSSVTWGVSQRLALIADRRAVGGHAIVSDVAVVGRDGTLALGIMSTHTRVPDSAPQARTVRLRCPG